MTTDTQISMTLTAGEWRQIIAAINRTTRVKGFLGERAQKFFTTVEAKLTSMTVGKMTADYMEIGSQHKSWREVIDFLGWASGETGNGDYLVYGLLAIRNKLKEFLKQQGG